MWLCSCPGTTHDCAIGQAGPSILSRDGPSRAPRRRVDRAGWMLPRDASVQARASAAGRTHLGGLPDRQSEEHTSELQSHHDLVCRLLLEKKKKKKKPTTKKQKIQKIQLTNTYI